LNVWILLGVQHLEQRARRIPAPVRTQLVDLVQQEHGVAAARAAQALDDAPRHGADVRAAVAADLGLVAHTAQGHAHEAAAERAGDGAAERRLAHARRTHEAQDRSLFLPVSLSTDKYSIRRSFTLRRPKWSSSSTCCTFAMSRLSRVTVRHGSAESQSM
jgi:hypothetical protein